MLTPSRCGRMDQCVVMGPGAVAMMQFYGSQTDVGMAPCRLQLLPCAIPLYFVVVDLMSSKDTVSILSALHSCFPLPKTAQEVKGRSLLSTSSYTLIIHLLIHLDHPPTHIP